MIPCLWMHLSLALSFSLCLKKIHLAGECMQSQVSEMSSAVLHCHSLTLWNAQTAPSALAAPLGEGTKGIVFIWVWDSAVKPPPGSLWVAVCVLVAKGSFRLVLSRLPVGQPSPPLPPARAGQQLWTCTDHGKGLVPAMEERACCTVHMRHERHSPP